MKEIYINSVWHQKFAVFIIIDTGLSLKRVNLLNYINKKILISIVFS